MKMKYECNQYQRLPLAPLSYEDQPEATKVLYVFKFFNFCDF